MILFTRGQFISTCKSIVSILTKVSQWNFARIDTVWSSLWIMLTVKLWVDLLWDFLTIEKELISLICHLLLEKIALLLTLSKVLLLVQSLLLLGIALVNNSLQLVILGPQLRILLLLLWTFTHHARHERTLLFVCLEGNCTGSGLLLLNWALLLYLDPCWVVAWVRDNF